MKKQAGHEELETSQGTIDTPEPPEGWAITRLGEIAEVIGGGTPKASDSENFSDNGYPWVTPADLGSFSGMYIQRGKRSLSERGLRYSSAQLMPSGAVLMSSRAPIGYVAIAANEISTNQGFKSFVVHKDILPEYVFYWLKFLRPQLEQFGAGSTFAEISGSRARQIPILMAPIAEQKRIVAKIAELLARVNATRERLGKVPAILKRFRQAVLAAACSGSLTEDWRTSKSDFESAELRVERTRRARMAEYERLCSVAAASGRRKPRRPSNLEPKIRPAELGHSIPQDWFWANVEDIASIRQHALSSGPFGSALGTKDYRKSGIPVIRGQNIQDGEFLSTNFTYVTTEKAATLSRSAAYPGDIVVVAVGSSGQAAVVPDNLPKSILSQNCNKITVDEALVIPEFALLSLRNDIAKDQLTERTTDTARPFLSLTNLKRTVIAILRVAGKARPEPPLKL